jgi:hypothetical protein
VSKADEYQKLAAECVLLAKKARTSDKQNHLAPNSDDLVEPCRIRQTNRGSGLGGGLFRSELFHVGRRDVRLLTLRGQPSMVFNPLLGFGLRIEFAEIARNGVRPRDFNAPIVALPDRR